MKTNFNNTVASSFEDEETVIAPEQNVESSANGEAGKGRAPWRSILKGVAAAAVVGVAGLAVPPALNADDDRIDPEPGPEPEPEEGLSVAEGVNDGMDFREAFYAAREEVGPGGLFSWHGNIYSTYEKEEWDSLDPRQQADYGQLVQETASHMTVQPWHEETPADVPEPQEPISPNEIDVVVDVTDDPTTPGDGPADNLPGTEINVQVEDDNTTVQVEDDNTTVQVEDDHTTVQVEDDHTSAQIGIIGVSQVLDEDGTANVAYGFYDGHRALFVDNDLDAVADTVGVDLNDDGEISDDEIFTPAQQIDLPEDESLIGVQGTDDNGLGDYINNADVDGF